MSLIFIDGFDHYDDPEENLKWYSGDYISIQITGGRFGGGCFKTTSIAGSYRRKSVPVSSSYYVGFAWKPIGAISYNTNYPLIAFLAQNGQIHLKFTFDLSGYFRVLNSANTQLAISSNIEYRSNIWQYIEVGGVIHDTTGIVKVQIGGIEIINETGLDTKNNSGDTDIGLIQFRTNNIIDSYFDDLYIDDAQFHGDCRVRTFMPDSISSTNNDFTASAGNKDECVDEVPPNNDTDYIVSDTLNHKQGFGITTGSLGTVIGVQLNNHVRIDEAGTRKITPLIRSNSTDYSGTESGVISADYNFVSEIWETDPDDSGAWTQTKLEAAEFGLEITI